VVGNSVPTSDEREPRRIEVRRADTGEIVRVLDAAIGATARWSGDGRWLIAASLPDRVELWRTSDWTRGPGLAKAVQSPNGTFALSPDGEWLAAFNEVDVMLVSTRTGEVVTRLPEPPGTQGYMTDMAFGPDGRTLALLRRNAVLALWDVARLREELDSRGLGW
jgi:WD40 repeat protein